jgi:hypothetical protein
MATWCISAFESLDEDLIKNAWRHHEFGWFDAEEHDVGRIGDLEDMEQPDLGFGHNNEEEPPTMDGERIELGVSHDDLFEILSLRQT